MLFALFMSTCWYTFSDYAYNCKLSANTEVDGIPLVMVLASTTEFSLSILIAKIAETALSLLICLITAFIFILVNTWRSFETICS